MAHHKAILMHYLELTFQNLNALLFSENLILACLDMLIAAVTFATGMEAICIASSDYLKLSAANCIRNGWHLLSELVTEAVPQHKANILYHLAYNRVGPL